MFREHVTGMGFKGKPVIPGQQGAQGENSSQNRKVLVAV
jgi:hypothetical protein